LRCRFVALDVTLRSDQTFQNLETLLARLWVAAPVLSFIAANVVIVADHRGPASDPPFVKAVNIGIPEHVADRHIDPCAWRRLT
jgi:hypothetical protein